MIPICGISTGHSEHDSGCLAINGQHEYQFNVDLVADILEFTTPNFDWYISDFDAEDLPYPNHIWKTVQNINESGCIAAIEVHHNSSINPNAKGGAVIYWDESPLDKQLAECISKELDVIDDNFFDTNGFKTFWKDKQKFNYQAGAIATIKHLKRRLYFLGRTVPPSVIIEPAYLSNIEDLVFAEKFRLQIAFAIRKGVSLWIEKLN